MTGTHMRRREFIALLGGAATWPVLARAQRPTGMRRVGVLMNRAATELDAQSYIASFTLGLHVSKTYRTISASRSLMTIRGGEVGVFRI
jgi:hypothetical protein